MSAFNLIDMAKVPVPDVIERPDFETKYLELKTLFLKFNPVYQQALDLESDPVNLLLQTFAYRELVLIEKINAATRGNMLATASGHDLDAIAARYNITRLVVQEDPVELEQDEPFKRRIQMSFNGLNTAGSSDSYVYHALSASVDVLDADATSPSACNMVLTILARKNKGVASADLLAKVRKYFGLNADGSQALEASKIRPIGDRLSVVAANIVDYVVDAELSILPGPATSVVVNAAQTAVEQYTEAQFRLGYDITRSGLFAALHQAGVHNVNLISPASDLIISHKQAGSCRGINIRAAGSGV